MKLQRFKQKFLLFVGRPFIVRIFRSVNHKSDVWSHHEKDQTRILTDVLRLLEMDAFDLAELWIENSWHTIVVCHKTNYCREHFTSIFNKNLQLFSISCSRLFSYGGNGDRARSPHAAHIMRSRNETCKSYFSRIPAIRCIFYASLNRRTNSDYS